VVGVGVIVEVGLTVGVGEATFIKQLKSAANSKVLQDAPELGVGVGQIELKNDDSKSGQILLLLGCPDSAQVTPKYSDKHHLVAPEL
jgi:hypothetical protein